MMERALCSLTLPANCLRLRIRVIPWPCRSFSPLTVDFRREYAKLFSTQCLPNPYPPEEMRRE